MCEIVGLREEVAGVQGGGRGVEGDDGVVGAADAFAEGGWVGW